MAQTLDLLIHRTETMRSIRGIVRTMKTMSAINALPYEQAARTIETYRDTVLCGFQAFMHCNGPLPVAAETDAVPVLIAFGSHHGLCGSYNESLAEMVAQSTTDRQATRVICIGAQMEDALTGLGIHPITTLLPPATAEGLGRLAGALITHIDAIRAPATSGAITVSLVFMQRGARGQQSPALQRLLPLDPAMLGDLAGCPWDSRSLPQFHLPTNQLLAALIRSYLFAELFRAGAEALLTENAARLTRMQQAEQSVDDRLEELLADTRSVRQSEITTELLDVIVGFEALKSRDKPRLPHKPSDKR